MRNHAFLKAVLLGLLTFALVPGIAGAASQGHDLTGMLSSSAAERATALSGPIIAVSPGSVNFGTVNAGTCAGAVMLTITNTGDANLNVTSIATAAPFTTTGGAPVVAPHGTYSFSVDYCPTDGSAALGNLTIMSDATNGATFNALLQGRGNTAPAFTTAIAPSYTLPAFAPFSLSVSANDAEGDPTAWSFVGPPGPVFASTATDALGNSSATLSWTPSSGDVGNYPSSISITDGRLTTSAGFTLAVTVTNNPPVATPGGPYNGIRTVPLNFNGSGSSDPNGDALSYAWSFGDGGTGTGATVSHTYSATGNFIVSLTVTDNGTPALSDVGTTTASIVNFIPVQVTAKLTKGAIKTFGGGRQAMGAEPSPSSGISALDIDPTTMKLSTDYPSAGTVAEISADLKGSGIGDLDGDGLTELVSYFTRSGLGQLLSNVPNNTIVNLILTGTTTAAKGSVPVRGTAAYMIKSNGGPVAVSSFAAPNPFNPETSISYTLRNQGSVSIRIYSVNGQLVRSLREEFANPGTYEVRWNGTDNSGRPVRSGIYFVNVVQGANSSQNKVVVAK